MSSLKILSVNKYHKLKGGSETIFFGEMRALIKAGHSVIPFSMHDTNNLPSEYSEFFVNTVDYEKPGLTNKLSAAGKILYSFEAKRKISALLDKHPVDLAHLHIFQHQISPSILSPLRKNKIPVVASLHDLKPICGNYKMFAKGAICEKCKGGRHYQMALNRCNKGSFAASLVNTMEMYLHGIAGFYDQIDIFIAVSEFYRQKMIEFGFSADKIVCLPSFVDASNFTPAPPSLVGEYMLYFGRLAEEKGIQTFIKAAAINPNIEHIIVGTGPEETLLRDFVEINSITNVTFAGFQSGAKLTELVSQSRAVVVPSEWYENSPLTVLEAMAYARPVIGSDIGGIPELICDGNDGLLFAAGNEHELADRIQYLWAHGEVAHSMGVNGREKVISNYNCSSHLDGLLNIYAKAMRL